MARPSSRRYHASLVFGARLPCLPRSAELFQHPDGGFCSRNDAPFPKLPELYCVAAPCYSDGLRGWEVLKGAAIVLTEGLLRGMDAAAGEIGSAILAH